MTRPTPAAEPSERASVVEVHAVIFDLDGTLVDSRLDFAAMRRELDAPDSIGLLEHIATLASPAQREEALAVVHRHEIAGAENATWMPGAEETVHDLFRQGVPIGIVTRNSRAAASHTMQRLAMPAMPLKAREDAAPKPDPEGLLALAREWDLAPTACLYVGDFRYDIEAAERAGMLPVLYIGEGQADAEYLGRATLLRDFRDLGNSVPIGVPGARDP